MIETRGKIGSYCPLISFSIAALLLLEIPIESAIILVYVLTVTAGTGQKIAMKVGYNGVGVGIGSVVGVGAFTFGVQLLLLLETPSALAHWSVILTMTIFLIFGRFGRSKPLIMREVRHQADIYMSASVALVVATLRQPWMLPFTCVVVAFGIWLQGKKLTAKSFLISSLLAIFGWFASSLLRPIRWWYFYADNDFQFFESLSWSIARWGVFEHPGFVGGSIAQYHWLSYGFYGGLSELASLEPWTALLKIGPILSYFVLAELITNASPKAVNPNAPWRWIVLVFVIWLTRVNIADSWAFSILIAVAFLRLSEFEVRRTTTAFIILWLTFSATLIFSKITTAIVVAVVLFIKIVLNRTSIRNPKMIPMVALASVGTIIAGTFFRGTGKTTFKLPQLPTNQILEDFLMSLTHYGITARGSPGLLAHLAVWGAALAIPLASTKKGIGTTGAAIALLTPISLFATLFFQGNELYFFRTPHFLLSVYLTNHIFKSEFFGTTKKFHTQSNTIILILPAGILFGFFWRHKETYSLSADHFQLNDLFLLPAILFLSLVFGGVIKKTYRRGFPAFIHASCFLIAGSLISFQADDFLKAKAIGVERYSIQDDTEAIFGTKDLLLIGEYVRQTTDLDMILASNNFYPNLRYGGANYLLPAECQRRFLLQGLRFQIGMKSPTEEQLKRMNLSKDFANQPSASIAGDLKTYGVEGFIVNLSLTHHKDWTEFANEVFRSGDFVFLILK